MLKCDLRAFARCPTRHLCGSPEDATFAPHSEGDKFNQSVLSRPMTNADSIRATDDELATMLHAVKLGYAPWCDNHCKNECDDGCDYCIK